MAALAAGVQQQTPEQRAKFEERQAVADARKVARQAVMAAPPDVGEPRVIAGSGRTEQHNVDRC